MSDVSESLLRRIAKSGNLIAVLFTGRERSVLCGCGRSLESRHWAELPRGPLHISTMWTTENYLIGRGENVWWVKGTEIRLVSLQNWVSIERMLRNYSFLNSHNWNEKDLTGGGRREDNLSWPPPRRIINGYLENERHAINSRHRLRVIIPQPLSCQLENVQNKRRRTKRSFSK